ncbi:MAG: 2OG-Fe(II) oxygenase family protein [Pseudomonadota bacterium]
MTFAIQALDFQAPDAPQTFVRSLHETGFAVLANHPVTPDQIDAAYAAWGAFYGHQAAEKAAYQTPQADPSGYFPFRSENAKGAAQKDLKEFFQVYPDTPLPDGTTDITRKLYGGLTGLGQTLLGWIEDHTPPKVRQTFSAPLPKMLEGSDQSMLRILHYPAQDNIVVEEGAVRAAAHEDINLITLLIAGSSPGLQAQDASGTWHEVPCDPGMIAVNIGDMLELASGGYYPSTTHRVVNPDSGGGARFSMPMFVHPRPDVALSADKTAGQYLAERLREIGLAS